ncbi:MAG: endolytic transglycosylase MltG [Ectobacillus sp.]
MIDWNEQRRKKKRRRRIAAVILTMLFIGVFGYAYVASALQPLDKSSKKKVEVTIEPGTSTAGIGNLLEEKGVIKSGTVFQYYVKTTYKRGLQAGTYLLGPSMSMKQVADQLTEGKVYNPVRFKVSIPEGSQLVEITNMIAAEFNLNKDDILRQLNDQAFIARLRSQYPRLLTDKILNEQVKYPLEGYLYPATYSYHEKSYTLEEIIKPMLEKTNEHVQKYEALMKQRQLDVHQFITIASLIEEEATGYTDRQKIASVFYNRLKADMPLQTDPTVLYALGKHKERVLYADLKVDSPYNTYKVKGLPVGPIANAGDQSMKAAVEPAQTDYYYFLAAPSGEVFYARTLEEHNALKAKYIMNQP